MNEIIWNSRECTNEVVWEKMNEMIWNKCMNEIIWNKCMNELIWNSREYMNEIWMKFEMNEQIFELWMYDLHLRWTNGLTWHAMLFENNCILMHQFFSLLSFRPVNWWPCVPIGLNSQGSSRINRKGESCGSCESCESCEWVVWVVILPFVRRSVGLHVLY